jgi:hypothetical protein
LTFVGDRREVFGDSSARPYSYVVRHFISTNGTMAVTFSTRRRGGASIRSWTESGVFTTTVGKVGFFAVPLAHHCQHVPSSTGLRDLVAQHEKWLRFVAAMTTEREEVSHVITIDEIVERTKADHVRVVRWRNGHSDDELLRKDLEGLLGAGYEKRGGTKLFRLLAAKPPTARIRKPSKDTSRP